MEAYTDFAEVYDTFMDETPYREWSEFLLSLLSEFGIKDGIAAELGCGTGSMTMLFAKQGFDMIGIDNSSEMLNIAMDKKVESERDILYLNQDMREFELYGTVRIFLSICDSVNYVLDPEDLIKVFCLVNNYLDPKGYFLFDFNTVHKYRDIIGDTTIAENREHCSFIWDNFYHEDEDINEYELTVFVEEEEERFRKFTESHFQRGYTLEEMTNIATHAGMKVIAAYDGYTRKSADENSERILMVVQESGKK